MNDLRKIVRLAKRHGFTVARARRGSHLIFRDPDGRQVAVAAGSASDCRSLKNTVADLRAAGLPIPHKGGRIIERGNRK